MNRRNEDIPNYCTARIDRWFIETVRASVEYDVIYGYIYEDKELRFSNNTLIRTSPIMFATNNPLEEGTIVHTSNHIYLLGPPKTRPKAH